MVDPVIEIVACKDSARTVILHPEIVGDIAEDGTEWDDLPDGPIYLAGFVGTAIIGAFVIEKRSRYTADVHVQVLPKYRENHALAFGSAVMAWAWDNTELEKLTAEIPVTHPNVRAFAERQGFEVEGINRRSLLKGGILVDQWYMGAIRPE